MITSTVVLTMTRDDIARDRLALTDLIGLPLGQRVALNVGARFYPPASSVALIRQSADRLVLDVHGTSAAVRAWLGALDPASDPGRC